MKIVKLLLLILVLALIIITGLSIIPFINKFRDLGNVEQIEPNTPLKFSSFLAKNLRTSQTDTLHLKGVSVVNFWASWCKPCLAEQQKLERLASNYPQLKFSQLSFDEETSQRKIVDSLNWNLPAYSLSDTSFFKPPDVLPMTLLLRDSVVIRQWFGAQNWQDSSITNLVDKILNN